MCARARPSSSSSWNVSSPYFFLCCLLSLIFIIVAPSLASSRYTVVGNNDYMTMNTVDSTKLFTNSDDKNIKVESYNGFFNLFSSTSYGAQYHYWFFPKMTTTAAVGPSEEVDDKDTPLIVWFNGGPGCSSIVGVMLEHGPFQYMIDDALSSSAADDDTADEIRLNPHRWNQFAHVLYIDSPLGAGFSRYNTTVDDIPNTAQGTMNDVYLCLQLFLFHSPASQFDQYRSSPLHIAGESYGAKHVLHLGAIIDEENEKIAVRQQSASGSGSGSSGDDSSSFQLINLRGLMLLNGWFYSEIQHRVYIEYAYLNGMIDYQYYVKANTLMKQCMQLFANNQYEQAATNCSDLYFGILSGDEQLPISFYVYDVRKMGSFPEGAFTEFMNQKFIKEALENDDLEFETCGTNLFRHFIVDFHTNDAPLMAKLLPKYPVLLLDGQFDIRSSVFGVNELVRYTDWSGKYAFDEMPLDTFIMRDVPRASFKSHNNLILATVYGAGHLTPMDQPESTFNIVQLFVRNSSLCSATKSGKCNTAPACPQQCSKQGRCDFTRSKCVCNTDFSGEICNEANKKAAIGENIQYRGYIFGKQMNTYVIPVSSKVTRNKEDKYDLSVSVTRSSQLGKLHFFIQTGSSAVPISKSQPELLVQTFSNQVLEDGSSAHTNLNQVPLQNNTHITIVVMNTMDTEVDYTMDIGIKWSNRLRYNTALIGSIFSFASLASIAILLSIVILIQYFTDYPLFKTQNRTITTTTAGTAAIATTTTRDGVVYEQVQQQDAHEEEGETEVEEAENVTNSLLEFEDDTPEQSENSTQHDSVVHHRNSNTNSASDD